MESFSKDAFDGYVAAFLDGEGSIIINKIKDHKYIRCIITNTHKGVIYNIRDRLGYGSIYTQERPHKNYKKCYRLYIDEFEEVEKFLKMIRPYLIIKADKADLALEVVRERKETLDVFNKRNELIMESIKNGIPQVEIAKKFGLTQQGISSIKSRGFRQRSIR